MFYRTVLILCLFIIPFSHDHGQYSPYEVSCFANSSLNFSQTQIGT